MAKTFDGTTVLVTGGTGGIGRAVAEAFAAEGALVVVSGRDVPRGNEVVARIASAGGTAVFVRADLSSGAEAVAELASAAVVAVGGPIDVLVNNAAFLVPGQSMFDVTDHQIDAVLTLNVKVPMLLAAALAPAMIARGHGSIVNIGSINGTVGMAVAGLYGASKAALHSLTKSWAAELAAQGVRVNTVAPGPTKTETNKDIWPMLDQYASDSPRGEAGTGDGVAAAVLFLASSAASHIHGVTLAVDGGATTR